MKYHFLILFLFLGLSAQAHFDWNENCQKAYTEIIQLKFRHGKDLLEIENAENPNNKLPFLIENYIDFLQIQIGEEKRDFERLEQNKEIRLKELEGGDENSPWFLYSQAEIHLQWAANRLKFGEYLTAAYEINKAYRLLSKNQKQHSNFIPNLKSLGVLHALIGSVPSNYSWALSAIGMDGSIKQGMSEMQSLIDTAQQSEEYHFLLDETYFMYSFLKMNLQNDSEGLKRILTDIKDSDNLLLNFAANRVATKLGENDLAITILENRKQTTAHYPFLYLEYLLGVGKQNKMDAKAILHFEKYVQEFKGQNYLKAAYMRISWHHLLKGDIENFKLAQANIYYYGSTLVDEDREAQKAFESGTQPQAQLLKARLLFDGGYYTKALKTLKKIGNPMFFSNGRNIIEYFYRSGRVYDALKETTLAKENYQKTIDLGRNATYYYAAKSALQMGIIWEQSNNLPKAQYYFEDCISMEDHEYEQSIEQKAKAGLNRIQ